MSRPLVVPGWPRLLLLAAPPLLLLAAGAALLVAGGRQPGGAPAPVAALAASAVREGLPQAPGLLVQVAGAVAHPGLYRLTRGDRVYTALAAAGGMTAEADPQRLPDLAARLRDGEQVRVPARAGPARASNRTSAPVDLNAATEAELAQVPGFTPDLAAEAVRYRSLYGGFLTPRELITVLGMGESDFQLARRYLRV